MAVTVVTFPHPNADLHAVLRDVPDETRLTGWAEDFEPQPHVTWTATPDGLRELAAELNASCQGDIDPACLEEQVRHEREHAERALAVGFTKVRYGLYVRRERLDVPGGFSVKTGWRMMVAHVAPTRPVTKLAYASISAAPAWLSAGDEEALRVMGYEGAADVRRRLAAAGLATS